MTDVPIPRTDELLAARFTNLPDNSSITTDKKRLSDDTQVSEIESLPVQLSPQPSGRIAYLRRTAPFIPAHDFARGAIHACQAALGYALMLAVM
jgi:copper transporter 1